MAEYLAFAASLSQQLRGFVQETQLCVQLAEFVSCARQPEHFVPRDALQRHLRQCHKEKHSCYESHQFFYVHAPGVLRVSSEEESSSAAAETDRREEDEEEIRSVMEPQSSDSVAEASLDDEVLALAQFEAAVRRVSDDVGVFYQQVQQWKAIPRDFERLVWQSEVVPKQAIERWIIAELSRTVFGAEPLEMELVEYIMGLLDHPEFREPDLLVIELHEFLGKHVARFVLSLWKFLVTELGMQVVFKTNQSKVEKEIQAKIIKDKAAEKERTLLTPKEATEKPRSHEPRDYKRRRPSYRGRSGGQNARCALRELLANQMLDLSQSTGRKLAEEPNTSNNDNAKSNTQIESRALDWMTFTDPLAVRDMEREGKAAERKRPANFIDQDCGRSRRSRSPHRSHRDRSQPRAQSRSRSPRRHRHRSRSRPREGRRTRSPSRKRRSRSRSQRREERHHHRRS